MTRRQPVAAAVEFRDVVRETFDVGRIMGPTMDNTMATRMSRVSRNRVSLPVLLFTLLTLAELPSFHYHSLSLWELLGNPDTDPFGVDLESIFSNSFVAIGDVESLYHVGP
jgi:hypothetical protein